MNTSGGVDACVVQTAGPVLTIGSGLLGMSLGLTLRTEGVHVYLEDALSIPLHLASDVGAGQSFGDVLVEARVCPREHGSDMPSYQAPSTVIVATPLDVADRVIVESLLRLPDAIVTDAASVKDAVVVDALRGLEYEGRLEETSRYIGLHPMAGRERNGTGVVDADLFYGRPWVIIAHESMWPCAMFVARVLATGAGVAPLETSVSTHDYTVALVSHVPQLVSSILAVRLVDTPAQTPKLAGQELRDTTHTAASDPCLWAAILAGNTGPVADTLRELRTDLDDLLAYLDAAAEFGPLYGGFVGAINRVMTAGNQDVVRVPGKHGDTPSRYREIEVFTPGESGALNRLFSELGEADISVENLVLEHSAGVQAGVARIMIDPVVVDRVVTSLQQRGWRLITH